MSNDRKRSGRGRRPGGRKGASGGSARGRGAPRGPIEPLHPTTTPPEIESFAPFALAPEVQRAIADMGIVRPTPIQALAIGPVLEGRDVIAQAETGTGKTLAFGAPMLSLVDPARVSVLGLVLCPTRELAEQVAGVLTKLGASRGISVALIVGGEEAGPQVNALKNGAQIVVGTPGRVLDLYRQKFLSFPWTEFAVLDEADEMLEIGFIDDVREILSKTPDERRTLLFSATFPPELLKLARECTKDPVEVATARGVATVDTIEQEFFEVADEDRPLALIRLIEQSEPDDVLLVFCERRTEVERLMRRLERLPYSIKALHGGYDQASRFRVMSAFRDGEVKALVATDVASRGLDVLHVTHVVNYSVPRDVTAYTHRIGRTGRAGRKGRAITLVSPMARGRWRAIVKAASWEIHEAEPPGRGPRRAAGDRSPRERDDFVEARPPRGRLEGTAGSERAPRRREREEASEERVEERPRRPRREERSRADRDAEFERGEPGGDGMPTDRDVPSGRSERSRRSRRAERPDSADGAGRGERPDRAERSERARRGDPDEGTERGERSRRSDGAQRSEPAERDSARRARPAEGERSARPRRGERAPSHDGEERERARDVDRPERAPRSARSAEARSERAEPDGDGGRSRARRSERSERSAGERSEGEGRDARDRDDARAPTGRRRSRREEPLAARSRSEGDREPAPETDAPARPSRRERGAARPSSPGSSRSGEDFGAGL